MCISGPENFAEYLAKTREVAAPYGAELVFLGKAERALTGDHDHGIAVIVKFPSVGHIDAWFDSDAYVPLAALRDQAADARMTSYEVVRLTTPPAGACGWP